MGTSVAPQWVLHLHDASRQEPRNTALGVLDLNGAGSISIDLQRDDRIVERRKAFLRPHTRN